MFAVRCSRIYEHATSFPIESSAPDQSGGFDESPRGESDRLWTSKHDMINLSTASFELCNPSTLLRYLLPTPQICGVSALPREPEGL